MGNKTLVFKKIPTGFPVAGEHLAVENRPFSPDAPAPKGGLVVETLYASYDPYLRGKMRDANTKSYSPPILIDDPFVNGAVARVLKSDSPDWQPGELLVGYLPIAEYSVVENLALVRKIHNPFNLDLALFLGPLGMPGITAYSSLYKIGQPKKGETIFVSSAAGAVGQVVGQVAKIEGLRVIGSAGSNEKVDFIVKELGFDGGFNYKTEKPADALKRLAPDGVDIYYDNVGGEQLEAALDAMNPDGRIPVCGMISGYNQPVEERYPIRNLFLIVSKTLLVQGFLQGKPGYADAYREEHQQNVQKWLHEGKFKAKTHVTDGIDKAAEGFVGMLKGENYGKAVLRIRD